MATEQQDGGFDLIVTSHSTDDKGSTVIGTVRTGPLSPGDSTGQTGRFRVEGQGGGSGPVRQIVQPGQVPIPLPPNARATFGSEQGSNGRPIPVMRIRGR